jgi:beta-lactamase regulating signal transducer with metallopeptidase domain
VHRRGDGCDHRARAAHLQAHDNLRRAFFSISPDLLALVSASAAMERAWHEAAERAADEQASGTDDARRVALASALVKVARLASAALPPPLPASALFRGEPIAERVRELIAPRVKLTACPPTSLLALVLFAAASAVLAALPLSHPFLYLIIETAIRLGR